MSIDKLVIKKIVSAVGRGSVCCYKQGNRAEISGEIYQDWCIQVEAERKPDTLMGVSFELHAQRFNDMGYMTESKLIESFESYNFSSLEHSIKKCIDALENPVRYICLSTLLPVRKCKGCLNWKDGVCSICDTETDEGFNCLVYKV